ncbi:E3 ubiquitin/ISG15 ligase TRIM25-like [Leptodactylus fuscus]|uniref:E3 ubiquitin/ISG15 ligase TRIM25-like n=1 Tax=Leptodactylus fuscus TaxID=238119 RepID=UPI003F4E66BA
MASADLTDELDCSICLHNYTDPVMLRCGHNFCRVCIDQFLDTQDSSRVYSCPECREEFQERPVLMRNFILCKIMESLQLTQSKKAEIGICCTYCVDSPVPAVKSCLHCEASLCDKHLNVHSKSAEHVLCEPSSSLEDRKCSIHNQLIKYYCTKDAACICVSCSVVGEHRGHQVEMLDEAYEKKKKKLRNFLQKLTIKREETEKRVQNLEKQRKKTQEKAANLTERVTALFTDIKRSLENLEKRVLSEIHRQEEQVSLPVSALIQQLETKKDKLSVNMMHIEELCKMIDPLTVLQEPDTGDLWDAEEEEDKNTRARDEQLHDVEELDVAVISDSFHTLSDIIKGIRSGIYVEGPADILLDVNTAGNYIHISDDLKTATWTREKQNRLETAERFQYNQVLSYRSFSTGRRYWDVEISKAESWRVGMCYPSMDRRGLQSYIGGNNKSWGLFGGKYNTQYGVIHNTTYIQLPHKISSDKVRIYVNYEAGQLSFYELCDPIRHLHTFTATFTKPLHAVLWLHDGCLRISGTTGVCAT